MNVAILHPFRFVDSIPTLVSVAAGLVERGAQISLFWCGNASDACVNPIWKEVIDIGEHSGHGIFSRVNELSSRRKTFARHLREREFDLVICVDAYGLVIGTPLARSRKVPVVYFSLELLFWREIHKFSLFALKSTELIYIRQTSSVIIQDRPRANALRASTWYTPKRLHELPNAWPGEVVGGRSNVLRTRLGIPEGVNIVVHAGSCSRWTLVAELAESAQAWPEGYVLAIQSRFSLGDSAYEARLKRAIDGRRVFFLGEPCPSTELVKLLSGATIGVALYKCIPEDMLGANLLLAGKSSGKFSTYLQAGLPVIVNRSAGLDGLVEKYRCGAVVERIEDCGMCLKTLTGRLKAAGDAARDCFRQEYCSEKYLPPVLDSLMETMESGRRNRAETRATDRVSG